jgi:gas vesicle protein
MLKTLTEKSSGAEQLTGNMVSPKLANMQESLQTDTRVRGSIPYKALKRARTQVGEKLEDKPLVAEAPKAQLKRVYGAMTKDMEQAAQDTGNPAAILAAKRASDFTKAGHARIDGVLKDVVKKGKKKGTPEKVYKYATNLADMRDGSSKIVATMKSLSPAEREVVESSVIRRLGLPTKGTEFRSSTFLDNWAPIDNMAKQALTSTNPALRPALDNMAQVAKQIRESGKVFANASGTARGTEQVSALRDALHMASYMFAGTSYLTARMMTSPRIVNWLSSAAPAIVKTPKALPQLLNGLRAATQGEPQSVQDDVAAYTADIADEAQKK